MKNIENLKQKVRIRKTALTLFLIIILALLLCSCVSPEEVPRESCARI